MSRKSGKHIVVVEAYQGHFEFLSDEPEELKSAQGLGLPIEEIVEALDSRFTAFCWDEWLRYELSHGLSYGSPFTWVEYRMMPHMQSGVQEMSGGSVKPMDPMQYRFRNLLHETLTKLRRLPAGKMRGPASDG